MKEVIKVKEGREWPVGGGLITARDADVSHIPIEYIPGSTIEPCTLCDEPCRAAPSTLNRMAQGYPLVCNVCAAEHFAEHPDDGRVLIVGNDTIEEVQHARMLIDRDKRRN
jgi:hypothetical protein